jgi:hypothetical protein
MNLTDFLKQRYSQAEKFTKKEFIEMAEKAMKDYEAEDDFSEGDINVGSEAVNKRYEFVIPMIFTNTEAIKASAFEKIPDVMFNARGEDDNEKKLKVEAAYKYISDKVDLETFMFDTFHWFVLLGFCSGHSSFKNESEQVPMMDQMGQPVLDEMGKPIMREVFTYNDPILEAGDPLKEVYSPDSEFSINTAKIPYLFRTKSVTPAEIKKTYGVDIKPDAVVDYIKDGKSKEDKDNKRCTLYFYYGTVDEEFSKEKNDKGKPLVPKWEADNQYYIIYSGDKVLYIEKSDDKKCKIGKWYGHPNKFFGYGIGKIGRQFQKEKSIRRGQQIRLADIAAFPKLIIENNGTTKVDMDTMLDPRENLVVLYEGTKPEYLQPGNLAPIVAVNAENADQDAQQAFGIMDISAGAQSSSTVDTATGQTIFAEAAQKRVAFAKKKYLKFIKSIIIDLLIEARDNWEEDKLVSITDEDGETTDVTVNAQDLKDIDFEKDIIIDFENVSVNKDILRQQSIAFYDKTKDDPFIERKTVIKDLVKNGFEKKNYKDYIKESEVAPGTILTDQNGQQFTVGESGELVSQQTENTMGTPSNEQAIKNQPTL